MRFDSPTSTVSFSEGAVVGTQRLLEPAKGSVAAYRIVSGNDGKHFRLHETLTANKITYLHLETLKPLDREVRDGYLLNISATSIENDQAFTLVKVNVLDINDNPPLFRKKEYSAIVDPNSKAGTSVIKVTADDPDRGKNGRLTYHMEPNERSKFSTHFELEQESGLLKTIAPLTCRNRRQTFQDGTCLECVRDSSKPCWMTVVAKDQGVPQQSAQTVIKIEMSDTNSHAPEITFRYLPDQTQPFATVEQDADIGTSVAAVTVTDPDRGKHGETKVEIVSGNFKRHFELQTYAGGSLNVLRVSSLARFERGSVYNLTLKAVDFGSPPKSSIASLIVKVSDVNIHPPQFEAEEVDTFISEDAPVGSSVATLVATDGDATSLTPSNLTYKIVEGNDQQWFEIHPRSGLITVVSQIDRETKQKVDLVVTAEDQGSKAKTATANVIINLEDVNDEAPQFVNEDFTVSVLEGLAPKEPFFVAKAFDRDAGRNGTVTYHLQNSDNFDVNMNTGEVFAITSIDRERNPEHVLQIVASDRGNPPKSSTATLLVKVKDLNDNSPVFYPKEYFVNVWSKQVSTSESIVDILAHDDDLDSKLEFSWDGLAPNHIKLDTKTGKLYLTSFNRQRSQVYKVSVKDEGGRSSPESASIHIVNVDQRNVNNLKMLQSSSLKFEIVEDDDLGLSSLHRQVGYVTLSSQDLRAKFYIVDGDIRGNFEIDSGTGLISTKRSLDREEQVLYQLSVVVVSSDGSNFETCQVEIVVKDLNDNVPKFLDGFDVIKFNDNSPKGQEVFRVKYEDKDEDRNGAVSFKLNEPSYNLFVMDSETGALTLKSEPQTEQNAFEISVTMTDKGNPPLTNTRSYRLEMQRGNRHTPVFDFSHSELSVSEGTRPGSVIIELSAVDLDQGDNGKLTYSITDGDKTKFGVFPSGKVYLQDYLDRETQAYHSLTITATDHGLPKPRSSTSTLVVYVTDENDNSPIFLTEDYVFYVKENEDSNSIVGRVTATDKDVGRNADLTYSFIGDTTTYFKIDERTGFISSTMTIDREELIQENGQDTFQLEVLVKDDGIVRKTATVSVNIIVIDQNDNKPVFTEHIYSTWVAEDAKIGTELITLSAKDIDKEENGRVIYAMKSDQAEFIIDPQTGIVTLAAHIDREERDTFEMIVVATDKGEPSLSSEATLRITVLDINDESPTFDRSRVTLKLSEGTEVGSVVHTFNAHDDDQNANGRVTYIMGSGGSRNTFDVDPNTGELTLIGELDRESRDRLELSITAVDGGTPRRSGSIQVAIDVTDVNDNAPSFPSATLLVSVRENVPIGTKIYRFEATDPDLGNNGTISYKIRDDEKIFRLDRNSGELFTNTEMDREEVSEYKIVVVASDAGNPESFHTEEVLTIVVEDVNDNPPDIQSLMTALVLPGTAAGTTLLTVRAIDQDASSNGVTTYEPQLNADPKVLQLFNLNRNTGQLTLKRDVSVLDSEPLYLPIIVSDEAVPSERKSSTAVITIVGGQSVPGPNFTKQLFKASVVENSPIGTPVGSVTLQSDSDFKFYIVECKSARGKERGLFTVDQNSGQVRSARKIDREIEGSNVLLSIVALNRNMMSRCEVRIV